MRQFATIGVYGFSGERFIEALHAGNVDMLMDVRQRRGVRGSEYAWANSARLQAAVRDNGIGYIHVPELAPTTQLRQLQHREDAAHGVGKRSRRALAPEYRHRYEAEILSAVDLAAIVARLPENSTTALFCVEADAAACHRSIIAERLAHAGARVDHIAPGGV